MDSTRYILMNKDIPVASILAEKDKYGTTSYTIQEVYGRLPFGCENISTWIDNRKASSHNRHLRVIMAKMGCEKTEGFLRMTHAATLNDTFWIKNEAENKHWRHISLYRSTFSNIMEDLLIMGSTSRSIGFLEKIPELTSDGSFRRCYKKENDGIYIYKYGTEAERNTGLEPYCEVMASELYAAICKNAVTYELASFREETASKCSLFTSEEIGFVPYKLIGDTTKGLKPVVDFFDSIGAKDLFCRMAVADAIAFNTDRHMGNYGVLIDNESQKILSMAPVFDFNLALFPYLKKDDLQNFGDSILRYSPVIGEDFTRIGQIFLTDEIREDLKRLEGFSFSFRGDDKFEPWRVQILEDVIHRQIEAVLSQEVFHTKEVFMSGGDTKIK